MPHKFRVSVYLCLFLFMISLGYSQTDTIKVDFGSNLSGDVWNNFNVSNGTGEITMLKNSRNLYTGMGINIYDKFNGINTGGTTTPDAGLDYPSTATSDSYYGNTAEWSGSIEPTAGLLFSGLNPAKDYTIEVFASRTASDNREAKYKFDGAILDSVLLNPTNNTANTVSVTMQPKGDGTIDLVVSPGPNNNNSYGFYYLGALKMIYEQEAALPPALTITAPNGGEELTGETNYLITWDAINLEDSVVISYSTNNGSSWDEIARVDSSQISVSWTVPNISAASCLVEVVSGTANDQSDAVFTIVPAPIVPTDTIKVDFGSNISSGVWNNFNVSNGTGEITMLKNSRDLYTGMGINIYDKFSGINASGTSSPDAGLDYPSTATSDSYFGNTVDWSGALEPTAGLLFSGLNPAKEYTIEVFASRTGVGDNREAKYKFDGATLDSVLLNASNNTANTVSVTMQPKGDGTIDLMVSPGPNNNNGYGFYYLGALKMIYEQEAALPPTVTVTAPNGGEELAADSSFSITWNAINLEDSVVISYSSNNGSSWDEIARVDSSQTSVSWLVPNIDSGNCLVQVVSGTANDQSDAVFTIVPAPVIINDTIMVDFGSNISEGVWNNFINSDGTGEITMLKNNRNLYTGMGINIYDKFTGINTGGTTTPDDTLGYPSTATSDSYFGNTADWSGSIEPTAGLLFSGLNPAKEYTIEIFASRTAGDNREAKYKFDGATLDSVLLNPSNNTSNTVSVTMQPKGDGTIDLMVSPGPNNDNGYGFYYLGALKMTYEQEDVLPPALTVTAPNGGEELTGQAEYFITWDNINLVDDIVISYSTNNGASWNEITTVDNSQTSASWLVPNILADSCLVQAVSGTASDQSDSMFTIIASSVTVNDTIMVDFGSNVSDGAWNNFTESSGTGEIAMLKNSRNFYTGMGINIYDRFCGINTGGTTEPDANLGYPSTATSDSYFGSTVEWSGALEPTGGMLISGLNPAKEYTFEIFASRLASDNRETKYRFDGATLDSVFLNPTNNTSITVSVTMQPKGDGTIDLVVSPGPNNDNSYEFYYLGALKIIYEQEEIPTSIVVTSPNGGEEWTKGTEEEITWASTNVNNVKIEFSADNGSTWDSIGTAVASAGTFGWLIPDINTDSALIKISDIENSEISDVSNNVFIIDDPISGDNRPLIVVLGSSTAAGSGASTPDSAWVWRYRKYVQSLDEDAYVVNLAVGGYTSYDIMPSDFTPPDGRPAPKTENNITKALTYKPWGIIINLPSNDANNNYTIEEQVFNMKYVTQTAADAEVPVWVTTTQPRNFTEAQRENLMAMRDSILSIYGNHAISIFDTLANADGTIKAIYNSGDGVHLSDAGHKAIFEKVVETKVWDTITDIADEIQEIPTSFALRRNYPNPFNPSTTIEFSLPVPSEIDIKIYDIAGREVSVLATGKYSAGKYHVVWDASHLASGMYIYRIIAKGSDKTHFNKSMKMLLIK